MSSAETSTTDTAAPDKRRYQFVCPHCLAEAERDSGDYQGSIYWDTSTYWSAEAQAFEADPHPNGDSFCSHCGSEGDAVVLDLDTGEELATGPHDSTYVPKAEADQLWHDMMTERTAQMKADKAEREAQARSEANAEALASYNVETDSA